MLWEHQKAGVAAVLRAIDLGSRKLVLTSPTGCGKTTIIAEVIKAHLELNKKVALYTNRKMLMEQISRELGLAGLGHGIRAAGYEDEREFPLQICSLQTEHARRGKWNLHDADLAIVDEIHCNSGSKAIKILDEHHEHGAVILGVTATPIDLGHFFDELIVAGRNSDGRVCGALVPCITYGPDEPDTRKIKKQPGEDLSENEIRQAMMDTPGARKALFARVFDWWMRLNPEQKPTILFAPGVKESIWFCEQFRERGIRAAHIDGQECWLDGEFYKSDKGMRDEILEGSRTGSIKVISNRFVLREGIDCPWFAHGIAATIFGSLQTYLQSGGRLLRAFSGLDHVVWQDHGGNWHRHGSLNEDRIWDLTWTANRHAGTRQEAMRNGTLPEPWRCSKCAAIRRGGNACPVCGHVDTKKSRPVAMTNGELHEVEGQIYTPRPVKEKPNTQQIWDRMYYRAKNSGMSWRQAEALFFVENHYYPPRTLNLQPKAEGDWWLKVKDVPREHLRDERVKAESA
jgi:superfamily II DNA or RNA helicase